MRKLAFLLAALSFSQSSSLQAQEDTASVTYLPTQGVYLLEYTVEGVSYSDTLIPATKIDPVVKCEVAFDPSTTLYRYSYSLSLLPSSQQYLESFAVDYSANIQQKQKPANRWDIFDYSKQHRIDWTNSNIDTTGLRTDTTDIGPGGSLGGFSYKSFGLPTIVNSYSQGNAPGLAFTGEPPSKMEELLALILDFPNNTVIQVTLGPEDPPSPFDGINFLDILASYTTRSRSLGWIKDQPTADKYLAYFSLARDKLVQGDSVGARTSLQQVLRDVDIDSIANLTSEAYALLKYNTEYLVGKLPIR